jgi:chemotaxis protein MotB
MTRLTQTLIVIVAVSLIGACGVKKETHQRVLDDLTRTQGELSECKKGSAACQAEREKLQAELMAAQGNMTEAERMAQDRIKKLLEKANATEAELMDLRKAKEAADKRLASFRKLQERFRKLVDTGKLKVVFRNGQMVLELPAGVLFSSGKAKLSKDGEAALSEVLTVLTEFKDRRFAIAGHTDNIQIKTRRFKNNWHLSTARAVSVVEFMIANTFDPKNLSAAGFGEFDPVSPNETAEGRQLNRRIEIILVPDLSELPNLTQDPS